MYLRKIDSYWSFRSADTKEYTHCYHSYPAMMVPQIVRKLLNDFMPDGGVNLVFDPYMGSGTTLVECSIKGIRSIGTDLNPLARFIGRVKNTHFDIGLINDAIADITLGIMLYNPSDLKNLDFSRISNYSFWYSQDALVRLSYLDQLIAKLDTTVQDFFRVSLSETVREVSFTRNGEFKRYRMSEAQLKNFKPDVFKLFETKVQRNLKGLKSFNEISSSDLASVYDFNSAKNIPKDLFPDNGVDMVVTSPPYGDSHTTVAYGQFSRWANEWFGFENAKTLDRLLMGGEISKDIKFESHSICKELDLIRNSDKKRYYEVTSFLNDYWDSIQNVANIVRNGGKVCYVVGNRRVKSIQINLDYFTAEMFEKCGFTHDVTIIREIPNKRMPSKNSPSNKPGQIANTMTNEYIVILTKTL